MKRKKPYIRLTNSEFAMMQLLWEAGRPLNRAEIMEIALRDPENPLFAKNSFHVIINNLIGYQFIAAFINDGPGRKNARRFAPLLTRNEYAGLQIATTEHYKAPIFRRLLPLSLSTRRTRIKKSFSRRLKKLCAAASKRKTTCAMKTAGVALSFFFFTRIRPESA